jgi:hypothetical protein
MLKSVEGVYRDGKIELVELPGDVRDETRVIVTFLLAEEAQDNEQQGWAELGMSRLEQEWDSPADAVYDDWKKLYGV